MIIRTAEERDYEDVKQIMESIHSLHVSMRPDIYRDIADCYPREVFMSQVAGGVLTVAEEDGRVVGLASFFDKEIKAPVLIPRKVLYIDTVGVHPEFRKRGIGHALVENIRKTAEEKGFDAIELDVNCWNSDAYALYSDMGFRDVWKRMSLELSPSR